MIYFEKLSLVSLFLLCKFFIKNKHKKKYGMRDIYYIDTSIVVERLIKPVMLYFGMNVSKLYFEMKDIKDEDGELIRLRIHRKDLFCFQKKILASKAFQTLSNNSWRGGRVKSYINKGLVYGGIAEELSVSRALYLIEVIRWNMHVNKCEDSLFFLNNRPWFDLYEEIALGLKIQLCKTRNFVINKKTIHSFIRRTPWIYVFLKNLKYKNYSTIKDKKDFTSLNRLYLEGRGDSSFFKNGYHTDFFWQINSSFSVNNVVYKHHNIKEENYLTEQGVLSISEETNLDKNGFSSNIKPKTNSSIFYRQESKIIASLISSYNLDKRLWSALFEKYNIKVFLSWYKYTENHIAISDAINDVGGISVIWQMAFDGVVNIESVIDADIIFSYSKFSVDLDKKALSKFKYTVITGYPKDYAASLLKDEAIQLREKLKANGAKKIIFSIDENSLDDSRWHTGHELQRDNYRYLLEKVIDVPWLGVIFKPKAANTLRKRLGDVADLLALAEKTGRCYVYEASGRHTTSAPPILAGLSADVCVHGHLCAGTAAIECALEGLPTLLIDREGSPFSKLNELPEGKVVFKDWPSTIEAIMEHFSTPKGIPNFGDWSSIIDELDPFRDGKAAYRMGTYLHWLIQGYEQGLDKESIMGNAVEKYRRQWGDDKVIAANLKD